MKEGVLRRATNPISLLLAVVIMLALLFLGSITTYGAEISGACGDGVNWGYDVGTKTLTLSKDIEGTGEMYNYDFEATPWYEYRRECIKIVIEEGVTTIGDCAFLEYDKVKSVVIPTSVTSIGKFAFFDCRSLRGVTIPEGVTNISKAAFRECASLQSINIPQGVTKIADELFSGCISLTGVIIPQNVTSIGEMAFYRCESLGTVNIPEYVTTIGRGAFTGCNSLQEVILPEGITTIEQEAFALCRKMKEIIIPEGVTTIKHYAFSDCISLGVVTIPKSVTTIESEAFKYCDRLSVVNMQGDIPATLEENVFISFNSTTGQEQPIQLMKIYVPEGSRENYMNASGWEVYKGKIYEKCTVNFNANGYDEIVLPAVEAIPGKTIQVPISPEIDGYVIGGWYKEAECINPWNFKTDVIKGNTTLYAKWQVKGSSAGEEIIDGEYTITFDQNGREELPIQEMKVKAGAYIEPPTEPQTEGYIFTGWYKETECINPWDFETDTVVADTTLYAKWNTAIDTGREGVIWCYDEMTKTLIISKYGPESGRMAGYSHYYTEAPWAQYANECMHVVIREGVTSIGEEAFYNFNCLESVTIANSVDYIEDGVFNQCTSLKEVTIPESVEGMGRYVFAECENLQSVSIAGSVRSIGDSAFWRCENLESVIISDGVMRIGREAFFACRSLQSVVIPDSVTNIEEIAFYGCENLVSVDIPDSVTYIGRDAFAVCSSLQSIHIPEGLTTINSGVFEACNSLESITIPESVSEIESEAFKYCDALNTVIMQSEVPPTLGEQVFHLLDRGQIDDKLNENIIIYVPVGSGEAYKTADGWSEYKDLIEEQVK